LTLLVGTALENEEVYPSIEQLRVLGFLKRPVSLILARRFPEEFMAALNELYPKDEERRR
jgi:hypothetical protein